MTETYLDLDTVSALVSLPHYGAEEELDDGRVVRLIFVPGHGISAMHVDGDTLTEIAESELSETNGTLNPMLFALNRIAYRILLHVLRDDEDYQPPTDDHFLSRLWRGTVRFLRATPGYPASLSRVL